MSLPSNEKQGFWFRIKMLGLIHTAGLLSVYRLQITTALNLPGFSEALAAHIVTLTVAFISCTLSSVKDMSSAP